MTCDCAMQARPAGCKEIPRSRFGMVELEMIACAGKYGFLFSREPRLNAKQGEKLRNVFYMLRERGTNAAGGNL